MDDQDFHALFLESLQTGGGRSRATGDGSALGIALANAIALAEASFKDCEQFIIHFRLVYYMKTDVTLL